MIDHDPIAPPPSLADILSGGQDRIGRVDFDARLMADGPTPEQPTASPTEETPSSIAVDPKPRKRARAKATLRPAQRATEPADSAEDQHQDQHEDPVPVEVDLDELTDRHEEPELMSFTEPPGHPGHSGTSGRPPFPSTRALGGLTAPSTVPEEDVAYLGLSLEEVAESARARMRAAEAAHLRHLEAIENETARRLELLTAQAELDAELIRLHARREAHAIVSAARSRSGLEGDPSPAERRLADVGGSFSRFAETLEHALDTSLPSDWRHPR